MDSTITWTGTVDNNANATIDVAQGNTFTLANGPSRIGLAGGDFRKAGTGTLALAAANNNFGTADVQVGILNIQVNSSLNNLTVRSGAAIEVQGNITVSATSLTINGPVLPSLGRYGTSASANTWSGNVTLDSTIPIASRPATIGSTLGTLTLKRNINNAGALLTVAGAGNTVFGDTGVLSGAGGLQKSDAGTLTLSGTGVNNYAGVTTVTRGVLNIQKASALGGTTSNGTVVCRAPARPCRCKAASPSTRSRSRSSAMASWTMPWGWPLGHC